MFEPSQPRVRTHELDNLRTYLTILVIFHHAALAYGGTGSFGYRSPYHPPGSSISLTAFNVLNQTFFMGLRTRLTFLKEKMKRLGIPTLIYSLLGAGIIRATVAYRTENAGWHDAASELWKGIKSTRGAGGPTWYTALLLTFDVIYVTCRPRDFFSVTTWEASEAQPLLSEELSNQSHITPTSPPQRQLKTSHVLLALGVAGMASFLICLKYSFGHIFVPLGLRLEYLPQYILYYCTGIFIQRRKISLYQPCHPRTIALAGVVVASMNVLGFFKVRQVFEDGGTLGDIVEQAGGGLNIFALLYSLLNEFVGFMIASLLLKVFHSPILSRHWHLSRIDLAKGSYAAFLLHIPVLVETMTFLDEAAWKETSPALKAATVGVLGVVKTWTLGLGLKWVVERCGWKGYL
ncbi:hypothetical protein CC86DRAFT_303501 [Ophiobolus disseminans]|uniref:Acyltransferase 3 domain-containing protein n=1 Tax=Ophiobolus disseminans TaxID=1469910 RepID=A0A6A6ZJA7_9PLEO|nr:hypothetical protein CC86DRAFT_303501 [Ophiobolus disseminans]